MAKAIEKIRSKLIRRDQILDVSDRMKLYAHRHELLTYGGFFVSVPGSGTMIALKPETVRDWVDGALNLSKVIDRLKREGLLICGCDGKSTRQVVIGDLGRQRYYCFKPIGEGRAIKEDSSPIDSSSSPQPPSSNPVTTATDATPRPLRPKRPIAWR